jgi:hypothetical protein
VLTADAVETGRVNTNSDDVDNNDNSERDDGTFTDDTDDNDDNDEDDEDLNSKEDTRPRTLDLSNRTIHTKKDLVSPAEPAVGHSAYSPGGFVKVSPSGEFQLKCGCLAFCVCVAVPYFSTQQSKDEESSERTFQCRRRRRGSSSGFSRGVWVCTGACGRREIFGAGG